ncbi:MAG TPA: Ig domain-containing protein, partial [Pirellulaceae bacterium]|nr:Ig domain-containing protein [Pirellulaceae bacterium]
MKRQRTLKTGNPANLRRQRELARYAKRSNLRLEMLEPRLALYAATLDLLPTSDSGSSNSDNITNATSWDIRVDGVTVGANINLVQNGNVIATAQAQGTDTFVDFTLDSSVVGAYADGQVDLVAADAANATDFTTPLTITKDTVADDFSTSSPTAGVQGQDVNYNPNNPEEGAGASYALLNSVESVVPAGATIDANSGLLTWVPSDEQIGAFSFQIQFTDAAGNTKTQNVDISIDPAA